MPTPTKRQFIDALKRMEPHGRQPEFLKEHLNAPGRTITARNLAKAVNYENFRGVNLQYGLLAKRIGAELGLRNADIMLLVSVAPKDRANEESRLVMRSRFAAALKHVGWV